MAVCHQRAFVCGPLTHASQLDADQSTPTYEDVTNIKAELQRQTERVQELLHLNASASVVLVTAPQLGVMHSPQPKAATYMYGQLHSAVRTHFTDDGYMLVQATQADASVVCLKAPHGPHAHFYPINADQWKTCVVQHAQQDLHTLWSMQGTILSTPSPFSDDRAYKTNLHCGRFSFEFNRPLTQTETDRVLTLLHDERNKVIQLWTDVLNGVDITSHSYKTVRRNALDFHGPIGGDQCAVHRENRAFEQAKRDKLARNEVQADDPMFMVHCSIERDEDCDCQAVADAAFTEL